MPSERRGTVTDDIAGYMRRLQGTSEWKGDKVGAIRAPVAKVSLWRCSWYSEIYSGSQMNWPVSDVVKNVRHFLSVVKRATGNEQAKTGGSKEDRDAKALSNKPRKLPQALFVLIPLTVLLQNT